MLYSLVAALLCCGARWLVLETAASSGSAAMARICVICRRLFRSIANGSSDGLVRSMRQGFLYNLTSKPYTALKHASPWTTVKNINPSAHQDDVKDDEEDGARK